MYFYSSTYMYMYKRIFTSLLGWMYVFVNEIFYRYMLQCT